MRFGSINRFIRFLPQNTRQYHEAKVNLTTGSWTTSPLGNGKQDEEKFHTPTPEDLKKADFVMKCLTKKEVQTSYIDKIRPTGSIFIIEETDYYSITVEETMARTFLCKINKLTGELFEKSEMNMWLDDDQFPAVRIY